MKNILLTLAATAALLVSGMTFTGTAEARPRGWGPVYYGGYYRPYYRTYAPRYYGYGYRYAYPQYYGRYYYGPRYCDSPGLSDTGGSQIMVPDGGPKDEPIEG